MKNFILEKIFRRKPKPKKGFRLVEVIVIMLITGTVGIILGASIIYISITGSEDYNCYDENEFDNNLKEIINTYQSIVENYYEEVDKVELSDSAIEAMLESLGDIHSTYMNYKEASSFLDRMQGDYYGIGAEISADATGYTRILKVFKGSPAEEVGLKPFDLVKEVSGESIQGLDIAKVADRLKGPEDTTVEVTLERDGEEIEYTITRKRIVLSSISNDIYNENVGYIKIDIFSNNTYAQFRDSLLELEEEGIDSLIIDVRNNSGGYLHRVAEIVSLFLPKDKIIYQLEDRNNVEKIYSFTNEKRNYPVVVLINEYSASASEILATALKESYNATIVGVKSVGKGTVQQTFDLESGGMVKYTIQKWLTPLGNWVNGKGITPDIEVEQNEQFYSDPVFKNDEQLKMAIEELEK